MDFNDSSVSKRFNLKIWKFLIPYLKPHAGRLIFVLIMMIVSAGVDAVVPLFTNYAVNNFVVPQTTSGIGGFVALYGLLILLQAITTVLYSRQCMILEMRTGRDMKKDSFLHLQKLPLSFYNQTSVGYILARVMSDTGRICGMVSWGFIHMIWNLFYIIGILISMFLLNAKMALIVLAMIPVVFIISLIFQPLMLRANQRMRRANSRITSSFNENITGAKTSKTLVIEDSVCDEFSEITKDMHGASVRTARLNAVYLPLITFFGSMCAAIVLYYSGTMVISELIDFGILSAFIAYAIAIVDPVAQSARTFTEFLEVQVNIERVSSLLNQPCTITDTPEVEEEFGTVFEPKVENYPTIKGDIEFDHVWFRYPDAKEEDYVLRDICLKIKAGTTVAIVGETGAGKSTMVNLACRFFEPTQGQILIDGVDYRERSQHWLHSNLGYVQQTPHLFSGTIWDNIHYGKLDATDEEIIKAAKLASVDSIAERLPDGYLTDVGESGDRLSTGEKQLVSFARAVIADPPLFVLDEATSSIDTETERLIQDAISHILTGRTSFIIAHRLSTISSADLILLIDGHGIREQGSHEELMAAKGNYYRLYTAMMIKDEADKSGFNIF